MIKQILIVMAVLAMSCQTALAQLPADKASVEFYTQEWTGERLTDGRPKTDMDLINRLKAISVEEVWSVLRNEGFNNQYEGEWKLLHENEVFVGRALTAMYMPLRPDVNKRMIAKGHNEGQVGPSNSWPIDMLQEGDVYVADGFGKIIDGTLIGDNLGNAIYAKSKTGVVFDASARDMEGLSQIEGFNAAVRDWHPSFLREAMLMGINVPVRIGNTTVFPGDVVLVKKSGVVFIPAHLLEKVVITSEFIALRDRFGHQRLREGKYTPGQIDTKWTDAIKDDFIKWLDQNPDLLPMSRQELDEYMKNRTW
ncbi:MAG: RraA family protein [Cyclobacteriaceae bacterium]